MTIISLLENYKYGPSLALVALKKALGENEFPAVFPFLFLKYTVLTHGETGWISYLPPNKDMLQWMDFLALVSEKLPSEKVAA